jgi:hypothetical protein
MCPRIRDSGPMKKKWTPSQKRPIHSHFCEPYPPLGVAEIGNELWTRDTSESLHLGDRARSARPMQLPDSLETRIRGIRITSSSERHSRPGPAR